MTDQFTGTLLMMLFHCMVRFTFGGVFHWVQYLVPDTFLEPPRPRFQASVPLPKRDMKILLITDWPEKINTACIIELAKRDTTDPLDLNQHSQRRISELF